MTAADQLQESMTVLGGELRAELQALAKLNAGREAARQAAIDDLLNKQADDAALQESHRAWVRKFVLGPLVLAVTSGGGAFGFHAYHRAPEVQTADVRDQVMVSRAELAKRVTGLEAQIKLNREILARMTDMLSDQQVHGSDAVFYLGAKIDRISSRARRQPIPDVVKEVRKRSWQLKQSRTPFQGYDAVRPLGDLTKEHRHGAH